MNDNQKRAYAQSPERVRRATEVAIALAAKFDETAVLDSSEKIHLGALVETAILETLLEFAPEDDFR